MKTILSWFPIGFYSSIEIYRFVTWNQSITFSPIRLAGRQKELGFIIHDSLEEAVVCVCLSLCLSVCLSVYASLFLTLFCRLLAGAWRPRAGPQPQGQPPRLTLTQSSYSQTRPEWPDAHRLAYGHMALALLCCTVLENYIHDDQCE